MLLDQHRFAIHPSRAEILVEEIELDPVSGHIAGRSESPAADGEGPPLHLSMFSEDDIDHNSSISHQHQHHHPHSSKPSSFSSAASGASHHQLSVTHHHDSGNPKSLQFLNSQPYSSVYPFDANELGSPAKNEKPHHMVPMSTDLDGLGKPVSSHPSSDSGEATTMISLASPRLDGEEGDVSGSLRDFNSAETGESSTQDGFGERTLTHAESSRR